LWRSFRLGTGEEETSGAVYSLCCLVALVLLDFAPPFNVALDPFSLFNFISTLLPAAFFVVGLRDRHCLK
jgi:hypothetical protein